MMCRGKIKGKCLFLSIIILFALNTSQAQKLIAIEFYSGLPYNVPLPLTISQVGEQDISLTAHYRSEPFEIPIYWNWRISYWDDNHAFEIEATHHKIFLKNTPPEIQEFSISHGFNTITFNYAWKDYGFVFRAGCGVVLAHPESILRGKKFDESGGIFGAAYQLTGPTINLAAGKRFNITRRLFFELDTKINLSYAKVPVADGEAKLYNIAVQFNFGLGFDLLELQHNK
jgi:hypothetical protein